MDQIRVNIRTAVNAKAIRREQYNGREHIVVPSFTLPSEVIMNEGLYPHDEIEAGYKSLEMTPAPLGHPQVEGEYVSASRPDAINAYHFGAFNKNVKREGNRIYVEKFIDVEVAQNSENGRAVLAAIDKGEPIHTSTGIFLEREMTPNADGHEWIARNMQFDHDAILLNEEGAATPAQGVGMLVNKQLVINSELPMQTNEDALKDSYGEKRDLLNAAVKERYATGDNYAYVEDFDNEAAVVCLPDRMFKVRYSMEDGNPILGDEVGDVVSKTEYELKRPGMLANILSRFKDVVQWNSKQTIDPNPEETQDMKPEELQAALDAQADKLQGAFNEALAALKAEHKEGLDAVNAKLAVNAEAEMAGKRAIVAEKLGEVIANSLTGEALDDAVARCQVAAPLVGGMPQTNAADDQWSGYSLNQEAK